MASPAAPTVGDTIWLEREIPVPSGWQIRAGKLVASEAVEPLGDPAVLRSPSGWVVRYAVVAWTPGAHRLMLPPIWRLAPDGRVDSLAGGGTAFTVASVIPVTLKNPDPRGPLAPLRTLHRNAMPPLVALAVTTVLLAVGLVLRRRLPRSFPSAPALPVPLEREVPDGRWLEAGEPKAVAVRATGRVRTALARTVPEAHPALATAECLAVVERVTAARKLPLRELRELLEQLDRVAYSSAPGCDVAALAATARRLAKQLAP
ncbi:MAG TPA: hypothetical protein VM716_01480 [Gemmatimonadales bacterium]|nr:hypothetical protein [Gemmatimonadales bacterium]